MSAGRGRGSAARSRCRVHATIGVHGIWPGWWCRRWGRWLRPDDPWEPYRLLDAPAGGRAGGGVLRGPAGVRGASARRSARMGWTCCAGSGSCGRSGSAGIGRRGSRRGTSVAGCGRGQAGPAALAPSSEWWDRDRLARAGDGYAAAVRAHCETVLRGFYDFHRDVGTGPMLNPFPLDRSRRGGRANAHHNPMEPSRNERTGLYRPRSRAGSRAASRRGVQRDLRPAAVASGPGAGGVLRVHRGPRLGVAVGDAGRGRPGRGS